MKLIGSDAEIIIWDNYLENSLRKIIWKRKEEKKFDK